MLFNIIPDRIKLLLFGFIYDPRNFISALKNAISSYYSVITNDEHEFSLQSEVMQDFTNLLIEKSNAFQKKIGLIIAERC